MESTHELAHHIQNLPPELADQIFELALAWDKDAHTIDEFYEPPTLLHIDRTSRQKYAYPFFNATFQVDNTPLLLRWLKSLPAEHLSLIKALRHKPSSSLLGALVANLPAQFHVIKGKARMQLASINATVANAGYHFADSVLHLLVPVSKEGELVWSSLASLDGDLKTEPDDVSGDGEVRAGA